VCSGISDWKRLIDNPLSTDERISLITSIFSDRNKAKVVGHLTGDDAQTFIDVTDEARLQFLSPLKNGSADFPMKLLRRVDQLLERLPLQIRKRCLRSLYRICGRQALLPRPLAIPLCYDPKEVPLCHGGFSDVWKGQYDGREVASKVLRVYQNSDLEQIRKVGRT